VPAGTDGRTDEWTNGQVENITPSVSLDKRSHTNKKYISRWDRRTLRRNSNCRLNMLWLWKFTIRNPSPNLCQKHRIVKFSSNVDVLNSSDYNKMFSCRRQAARRCVVKKNFYVTQCRSGSLEMAPFDRSCTSFCMTLRFLSSVRHAGTRSNNILYPRRVLVDEV